MDLTERQKRFLTAAYRAISGGYVNHRQLGQEIGYANDQEADNMVGSLKALVPPLMGRAVGVERQHLAFFWPQGEEIARQLVEEEDKPMESKPIVIFYAWQSDRDPDICRYLIRDAANAAIKAVNAKLQTEAHIDEAPPFPSMVLDHDTNGVPGIPKIAETIQKKISECDVFIADLTHTADYRTADGRSKQAQNGNVLIELGQALNQKRPERILLIMNSAFGTFETLPFDLHLHRKPITYDLPDTTDKAKLKREREQLTGRLIEALHLMISDIGMKEGATRSQATADITEVKRKEANRLRDEFEERVMLGKFQSFKPDRGTLALTMIPLTPLQRHIDFSTHERLITEEMPPLSADEFHRAYFADCFATHNVTDRDPNGGCASSSVSSLHLDGSIFAATVVKKEPTQRASGRIDLLDFGHEERHSIMHIAQYLRLIRQLGVSGPILLGLSLLSVKGTWITGKGILLHHDGGRAILDDSIRPAFVEIPKGIRGDKNPEVALVMKPLLDHIWRTANYPRDPFIGPDGNWISGQ